MSFPDAIGFDVETWGSRQEYALQPYRALSGEAGIRAASYARAGKAAGNIDPSPQSIAGILEKAADQGLYVVAWNSAFDCAWLIACGLEDLAFRLKWLDAMLLWRHWFIEPEGEDVPANKRKSYSLEAAIKEFFPGEEEFKEFDDFQATDAASLQRLLIRNKGDALFTLKLAELFWSRLEPRQYRAAMLEARCIPQVAWTYVHGIHSSRELAVELSQSLEVEAVRIETELLAAAPEAADVNFGSPKQLATLLYDTWGLPLSRTSKKTGDPSTDKYALFDLAPLDPRARMLKELRETKNNRTKYAEATIKSLDYNGDGCVRPGARIFGTYTSRMTYSGSQKSKVREQKAGKKLPSLWLRHPESDSFFVMSEEEYSNSSGMDLAACVELGEAKTGSHAELRKVLKACGWQKPAIDQAIQTTEPQSIPRAVEYAEKNIQLPTGVALHQWKRGKDYRRLIQAPPSYTLVELDAAGQEFRWMAVASGDETMLSLCAPGEDAHSYMGAQIAGIDYRELIRLVKAEDEHAVLQRKLGKFCIAEGELVLTDRGLVPIEQVTLDDRVWDGVEWVSHTGAVYQGEGVTITYDGLTATTHHIVYTEEGHRCYFWEAAAHGYRLSRTEHGGEKLRSLDHRLDENQERWEARRYQDSMFVSVWGQPMGQCKQPEDRQDIEVQDMPGQGNAQEEGSRRDNISSSGEAPEAMQCDATALRESKRPELPELRREGDRVSIPFNRCSINLYSGEPPASDIQECGHRQDRQQQPLRAWKSETLQQIGESSQHQAQSDSYLQRQGNPESACVSRTADTVAGCQICGGNGVKSCLPRADVRADRRTLETSKLQTKRLWDITNAGPRHRYTVSGRLVSNSNLSFQYRVSARTATMKARVDYELEVEEVFIKQILATYKQSYPGVGGAPHQRDGGYWGEQIRKCKMLGYAETFAGRRVQLIGSWTGREAWPLESTSINYPIQGTGGDQKYLALAVARNDLNKFDGYFYYELHDGLFFIFPNAKAEAAAAHFKAKLSTLPYKQAWGFEPPIAFPFDTKTGPTWGDLKDFEG